MPCNSAHLWYDELTASCDLPFLHIVYVARDALGPVARVGVVAAPATLRARLYPTRLARSGLICLEPTEPELQALARAIERVKVGQLDAAVSDLLGPIQAQLDRGAEAVILACTELPLLLPHLPAEVGDRCVDATDTLARAWVAWGLAQR